MIHPLAVTSYYNLVSRSYKHGDATPVIVGDRLFVAFCDDKVGKFVKHNKDTQVTTILDCSEVTPDCFEYDDQGNVEYYGDVRGHYRIKVKVPAFSEMVFYCAYTNEEIIEIKEVS